MEVMVEEKPLTPVEQSRLKDLEVVIRDNFLAYVAVGNALLEIRENRLYRNADGRTWEGYCRELWDMSHQRADQLIAAKVVADNLTTIVVKEDGAPDWDLLPANESQARELARLEPEEQKKVWRGLIEQAQTEDRPKITAKAVKNAVSSLKEQTVSEEIGDAKKKVRSAAKVDPYRESFDFTEAWEALLEVIEGEHRFGWKTTSREVVFNTMVRLAAVVGECGEQTIRDRKIVWRARNLEKLLSAGFNVFRISTNKKLIEQMESPGEWLVYGEYEQAERGEEAFKELMLEANNIQA